jgi:hypothetical protein
MWNYTIDWNDLKKITLQALDYNMIVPASLDRNRERIREYAEGGPWAGFTGTELQGWILRGYRVESLRNIANPPIKIREKRRLIFGEEGDEFHYDMQMSGDDRPFSSMPKTPAMPGVSLQIGVSFLAGTSADVISDYVKWACRAAYSIESAGIDLEVNIDYGNEGSFGDSRRSHINVRVKREGKATDFNSWSSILSPASLRGFGFIARTMAADSVKKVVASSQGRSIGREWNCVYDSKRRIIRISNPMQPRSFPEMEMTDKLRKALDDLNKSGR